MKGFLIKDPNGRLACSSKGLDELWDNSWFRGIDWDKLERKEYVSPMIPNPDKANFDATYDLEELLLEDNPLTYRPRKKKNKNKDNSEDSGHGKGFFGGKSGSNTPTPKTRLQNELDYIEEHFKTFDCTLFDRFTQLMENDKFLENPELMKILDEEFKNLSQQSEMPMKRPNNTHGPSGAVTEKLIKEKQIRLQAYHARMQLRQQQESQPIQPPGQTYNPNRNILQHNMMAGTSNFYNNSGSNPALYAPNFDPGNSNRSSPNNTYHNLHEDIHSYKNNPHYPMTPQYNSTTPPPNQSVPPPIQPLPPTPEQNFYNNGNNSTGRLEMSSGGNLSRNGPATSSLSRRNKNIIYGSNGSTGPSVINTPSDSPKIGSSYNQQLTSNSDRERMRQNQQLKQLTSSPQSYHQKLVPNKKLSQNHLNLNHSANSDSLNSLQLSNLKDEYSGDYNINMSRSMNNLNYSTNSNDDFKNILSKDELEELNDDFLFDRKNVFSKPMFHSSSMDEINTKQMMGSPNMGKGYNKVPNPKGIKQGNLNMTSLNPGGMKKEDEKVIPLLSTEEIQKLGNIFDNLSVSDPSLGHKKLRHGKSYDNLTAKKYNNRPNEAPPPLPNSNSSGKINYVMKYDFPIPPSNGAPTNRPYVTPSKNKGGSGYLDEFNFN